MFKYSFSLLSWGCMALFLSSTCETLDMNTENR